MKAPHTPAAAPLDASVLHFHHHPNPRFWLPSGQLRAVVRERLTKIADAYLDYLKLPPKVKVHDITFTGSLTGRNYTKTSDIDLHIILDYGQVAADEALAGDFFNLKRKDWALSYPVEVYGYPVELFAQDAAQFAHDPAGHYSLRKNRWVRPVPEPANDKVDDKAALALAKKLAAQADELLARPAGAAQLAAIEAFDWAFKTTRQHGLASKDGVYSTENLAFKILRNSGSLDKVKQRALDLQIQAMSLQEAQSTSPSPTMKTPIIRINESQMPALRHALKLQRTFMEECATLTPMLAEGAMIEEGVLDQITQKFRALLDGGGPALLRKTVMAAVLGGSLLLSSEAIAKAATSAGLESAQVEQLRQDVAEAAPGGPATAQANKFATALQGLEHRYVVDNSDQSHSKQFMKYTGNIADVVGIGNNGYPLFAKGSASQQAMEAAFHSGNVITGVVNMPTPQGKLKDFAGRFVKANGLYYTTGTASAGKADAVTRPAAAAVAPLVAAGESRPSVGEKTYLFDFSGLMSQAQQRFNFKKSRNGTVTDELGGQPKSYNRFVDYAYDFVRQSGTGLESYTDAQIDQLFAKGMKVRVSKLPGGQAAQ